MKKNIEKKGLIIVKKIIICLLSLIFLLFLSYLIVVWRTAESNDFDRPFINDGKDNDLKVVSNTDSFYIYPNTYICMEGSITPAAFYYMFGFRHATGYFRKEYFSGMDVLPESAKIQVSSKGIRGSRAVSSSESVCKDNSKNLTNIHTKSRIVMVKEPDTLGAWFRVRRGEKYITAFRKLRITDPLLGRSHPNPFQSQVAEDIAELRGRVRDDILKKVDVDPSILIVQKGDQLLEIMKEYDVKELIRQYELFGDEEIKKEIELRRNYVEDKNGG